MEAAAAIHVSAKNADTTTKDTTVVGHTVHAEDVPLKQRQHHSTTSGKSTATIEQPRSGDVGGGNQGSTEPQTIQVVKRTRGSPKPTCADSESTASTTAGPLVYDIVSIAQMILAELEGPKRKITRDYIEETEVQPYALYSYYFHRTSRPHLIH